MPQFDSEKNCLSYKLVYYGPALSGKTTNLIYLHEHIMPELSGEMMVLETKDDRTLFFDLLPLGLRTVTGMLIKLKLYTVPGQVAHDSTRKAVLSRADGVAFIADSQKSQITNNGESFENLAENIEKVGGDFAKLPVVVQFNKRDMADIQDGGVIKERWSKTPWPLFLASALEGDGVVETFSQLLRLIYAASNQEYQLQSKHLLSEQDFVEGLIGDISIQPNRYQ